MTTFVQILLVVIVATLTFLVAFAGVQVFHILHEFRQSLRRLNKILDNTQSISETASKPITAVNEFFSDVKNLVNRTQDEIISTTPDRVVTPAHTDVRSHREHLMLEETTTPPASPTSFRSSPRMFKRGGASLRN